MPEQLPLVTLYLSERCNSRCITCDFWRHGKQDLKLDDIRQLLPELAALRTRDVLVSGGEPLLNPDWQEIAELLHGQDLRLWLLTSGLALAKHAPIAARWFHTITVSLDGTNAQTYRRIRGVDAFDKICEGVRSVASLGVPTSLRVTVQKANFRELPEFVALAHELGASQVSFLAVDVNSTHAFSRSEASILDLALDESDLAELDRILNRLESEHQEDFDSSFIAESPCKLRRIRTYFAALRGLSEFPEVECNAPQFSAVIGADRRVSPCFFIAGSDRAPRAPRLSAALAHDSMRKLRRTIREGGRPECRTCVCSMRRDGEEIAASPFRLRVAPRA